MQREFKMDYLKNRYLFIVIYCEIPLRYSALFIYPIYPDIGDNNVLANIDLTLLFNPHL